MTGTDNTVIGMNTLRSTQQVIKTGTEADSGSYMTAFDIIFIIQYNGFYNTAQDIKLYSQITAAL